jgi:hypothetical protein
VTGVTFAGRKPAEIWRLETPSVRVDVGRNDTAQLGATTAEGLPLDLFSKRSARWLGVRVNGGDEQPRVLPLSVPMR